MENKNAPLLEMRNIQKDFFGNQVLTDINFTLKEGEVLGLVGENGAGKSTLMKILFGMDVIRETGGYKGDVLINGEKMTFNTPFDALKAGIGMVHQEFSLIPGFTATENILLNREPKKKTSSQKCSATEWTLSTIRKWMRAPRAPSKKWAWRSTRKWSSAACPWATSSLPRSPVSSVRKT